MYEGDTKIKNSSKVIRKVMFRSKERNYELLHTLEFDSTRKRMSVLVKDLETEQIILFCKGADNAVFSKCVTGDKDSCNSAIEGFSQKGWRTLALSYKIISDSEYDYYDKLLLDSYNDITNRDQRVRTAFDEIESNLTLIGATAVEDKLQEDVENTLETLRFSGIKIWVLTGDKIETAINISSSCKHFSKSMIKFYMIGLKEKDSISKEINKISNR